MSNFSLYSTTPLDQALPKFENDYILLSQNNQSVTPHNNDEWVQTGVGGEAQNFIQSSNMRMFLQNSNQVVAKRSGIYKIIYSAEIEFPSPGEVDIGIGYSTTSGKFIINNLPLERVARLQGDGGVVTKQVSGSTIVQIGNDTVFSFYDRSEDDVTILNSNVTFQREGKDNRIVAGTIDLIPN